MIRPPAHWTRVTAQIAKDYGIGFKDAKYVYDRIRETSGRTPSLRLAAKLPDRLPRELWNPPAKTVPAVRPKEKKMDVGKLPKGVSLAPKAKPVKPLKTGKPRKVPKKQVAKTYFQELLKREGLPVRAIVSTPMGGTLDGYSNSDRKILRDMVRLMGQGFRQIARSVKGSMFPKTKKNLETLFRVIFGENWRSAYQSILRALYGR